VLRIQQGLTQIRTGTVEADFTLSFLKEINDYEKLKPPLVGKSNLNHEGFFPEIHVKNLSFRFHDEKNDLFTNLNFNLGEGKTLAIFGKSGCGKTTLVDLILGLIPVDSGAVRISGINPLEAIRRWPGSIGYVPQDVQIVNGTIFDNLTLGLVHDLQNEERALQALTTAQLSDFVSSLPLGIYTQVGNAGVRLSGGQKQRLGIARSLYTMPKLLVMDEPTSALDNQTSLELHEALVTLQGTMTILVVTHNIETAKFADQVLYLKNSGGIFYKSNLDFLKEF
jgi:ABC-type multidrug transport system fused ATPase/permease subunit